MTRINAGMTTRIYRLFPGPETLTLFQRQTGEGEAPGFPVPNCRISPQEKTMDDGPIGRLAEARTRWLLPSLFLNGIVPKDGDVLQRGNGERYTIDTVDRNLFANVFACETILER